MSYSIIYGRQFVKTTKGIIPMILSGSNNCTEFIQGREVLERNWYPMTLSNKDKRIAIPAEELLERARAISTCSTVSTPSATRSSSSPAASRLAPSIWPRPMAS